MLFKRPLMYASLSFVAGMYITSFFDIVNVLLFAILTVFVLILLLIKRINIKNTLLLLMCTILFISGNVRYELANDIKKRDLYPYADNTVSFSAEITQEPIISEKSVIFIADILSVSDKIGTQNLNEKVRFSKYIEKSEDANELLVLKMGDIVSGKGKIKIPKSPMNKGGFDYAEYLKSDNIFFQCNIESEKLEISDHTVRPAMHFWKNFRKKCITHFDDRFPLEERAFLRAFVTGDSSFITDDMKESFSNSGLSHILAVSGLHVAVFISLLVSLLKLFNVSKRKEMLISAIMAMFFVFFTGASVSALRAGILAIFALIAKLIYRKADPLTTLSLAAALFCMISPHIIFSASFMLSFAATFGILIFYNSISVFFSKLYIKYDSKSVRFRILRNICDSVAVGLSAQILVTPLLVYLFNGFSIMSLISTLIVTPFLSFLLAGGLLFIAISFVSALIATPVGGFIYYLSKLVIAISDFFGGFSFSKIIFGEITPFLIFMYALFIAILFFAVKRRKSAFLTVLISFTVLSCIGLYNTWANYNIARLSFINVGQGDCALFKAPGDCDVLFDCGGYEGSDSTGEYVIAPYLIKSGVTDIEYIIISHMHSDHTVGLFGVLDKLDVDNLILPYGQIDSEAGRKIIKKATEKNVKIHYFTAGDILKINDEISITAIAPDSRQMMFADDENESGIVVRLDYGESSFLFTGDITSEIEKYLVTTCPKKLEADVLKVAHHGSKYSTCTEFLDVVKPEYAYIPVGSNRYGHPAPEVFERFEKFDTEIFRADIHNDVTFYFNSDKITGIKYFN